MSCLIDTEFLTRWRVNYGITRMEPRHKLPQFQEPASETWKRTNPRTEDCAENKEDYKTTDDWFENDHQSWLCCLCMEAPASAYERSHLPLVGGWSRPLDRLRPSRSAEQSKLSFPPIWPVHCLLPACSQTPHLPVTQLLYLSKLVFFLHPNVHLASYIR